MSVKVKGGMYCPACKKPVAAIKSGHAVRNTVGAAATMGLALKSERWLCPDCGGYAYNAKTGPKTTAEANRQETASVLMAALLVCAVVAGVAAHSFIVFVLVLVVGAVLLRKPVGRAFSIDAAAGKGSRAGQWRCEKNDHLLTAKHTSCPIDGSPVKQI